MIVKYGKEEITLEDVTTSSSLALIVEQLIQKTELERESIKLIAAGKNLLANGPSAYEMITIGSLSKGLDTKLVLMGTKKSSLEQLAHCPPCSQTRRIVNDLSETPNNPTFSNNNSSNRTVQSDYRFYSIHTLPLPNESKARAILTGTVVLFPSLYVLIESYVSVSFDGCRFSIPLRRQTVLLLTLTLNKIL